MSRTEVHRMPNTDPRRAALAEFLRRRRARLAPADVGLPPGRRRRTPGLRREEVAELAGVSADWYTRLEQGRDINASTQVLDAIAGALQLSAEERRHLFALGRRDAEAPAHADHPRPVRPALQRILDDHRLSPAYLSGCRTEILAWNRAATAVFGDFGSIPAAERTWLRLIFMDTPVRRRFLNWEAMACDLLAAYRAATAHYVGDRSFERQIAELLQASSDFRRMWPRHDVAGPYEGPCEFIHPSAGLLSFEATTLSVRGDPDLSLCIYTTAPESETAEKLTRLLDESSPVPQATVPVESELKLCVAVVGQPHTLCG
jgi:transcriptional regulator with XRE-family HTH domain